MRQASDYNFTGVLFENTDIIVPSEYFKIHCELSRIKGSSDKYSAAIFKREKGKKVWIQQILNVDYKSKQVL